MAFAALEIDKPMRIGRSAGDSVLGASPCYPLNSIYFKWQELIMSGRLRHVPFQVLLIESMLPHATRMRYGKWSSRVQKNRKDEQGTPMKP